MRARTFLVAPAVALGALTLAASPVMAHGSGEADWSGQARLEALNNSGTTGDATIEVHGQEATVRMNVSGAAETFMDGPFPHAQHIHIGAQGVCPTPAADTDGDGAVSVAEGMPFYGEIGASLTTEGDTSAESALAVERFPGGASYTYERTFELDDATAASLEAGTAVFVVHGVDPADLSEGSRDKESELDPELPFAATAPAACGAVSASQMGEMPQGGADTGSPVQPADSTGVILGAGALALVALGGGAYVLRRRSSNA